MDPNKPLSTELTPEELAAESFSTGISLGGGKAIELVARARDQLRASEAAKAPEKKLTKKQVRAAIIREEGQPQEGGLREIGDRGVYYFISSETVAKGGALKLDLTLVLPANDYFGATFNLIVTHPDGRVEERPRHFLSDARTLSFEVFPGDSDDEDDDLIRQYPPLTLTPSGPAGYETLFYKRPTTDAPSQSQ